MSSVSAQTTGPQKRTLSLVRGDVRPIEGPIGFDEMWGRDSVVRAPYSELAAWLDQIPSGVLDQRRREAELVFRRIGITFAVYGETDARAPSSGRESEGRRPGVRQAKPGRALSLINETMACSA